MKKEEGEREGGREKGKKEKKREEKDFNAVKFRVAW